MRKMGSYFILFIVFFHVGKVLAQSGTDIAGKAQVLDGDTIKIDTIKIRLHGVDAPESFYFGHKQKYGKEAAERLAEILDNKFVNCVITKKAGRYKRKIGVCYIYWLGIIPIDINKKLVNEGLAWAYTDYSTDYVKYQEVAKKKKRGLWKQKSPKSPWEFRKEIREKK